MIQTVTPFAGSDASTGLTNAFVVRTLGCPTESTVTTATFESAIISARAAERMAESVATLWSSDMGTRHELAETDLGGGTESVHASTAMIARLEPSRNLERQGSMASGRR